MSVSNRPIRRPWLAIRKELSSKRQFLLTLCSFILPLGTWCLVSYTPFIWHPDMKLEISADRENVTVVYTAGDHVSKEFFPTIVREVRAENVKILEDREAGVEPSTSGSRVRRANQKLLRHLAPYAVAKKWLASQDKENDDAIYEVWKGLATGEVKASSSGLSSENLQVIERNWELLSERSEVFDSKLLPETPLEKLVPQARPANPVYLPAPHEVLFRGWEIFTQNTPEDEVSMTDRYLHSLRIVFFGFFLSCLVGIPLGVLCGAYDFFSKLFEPFIDFFRYMPAPAFSTLLVAVFLAHDAPKIALVFVGTFFQMVLVVSNTTRLLDASLLEAAQTLGAKNFSLLRRVIIPGITPNLYNDMRILLGWSWTWLVIAELIGVKSGLTEFIETQGRWRNFDAVFPIIILIGVTGFVTDQILSSLRPYLFPWTPEAADKKRGPFGRFFMWLTDRSVYLSPKN
ncbi:ABC transporter permease [Pelagicoccus albus]|uniref:ABC transporter permease n=1 Tax=Pelagicoccus albus TaxID=415222 RepID=A0A7X1EA65_9BACT|nr:ABC transporter permease [Pelagicoccus albus]MBC2608179.1 ABC transporter permease [Pelagicoccus albus]